MNLGRIFLFGDINIDVSMTVQSFPPPGQDAYADQLAFNLGGSSTNTAIVLKQLGAAVTLFGSIGQDLNGDFLLRELISFGLEKNSIQRKSECPSGQIFLPILPDGERSMYSYRGANVYTRPEDIPPSWQNQNDLLHLSGYVFLKTPQRDTAFELIDMAKGKGLPISLDTGLDPVLIAHDEIESILDSVTIWICGTREGSILTGAKSPKSIIQTFFDHGARCVALKLGHKGCLLGLEDNIAEIPALSIDVVDTTGCGDAFTAGILFSWLRGFNLSVMGMMANGLGAYTASHLGSIQPGLSWASLLQFLRDNRARQLYNVQSHLDVLLDRIREIT